MSFEVHSQKTLYISPLIGIENSYCALSKNSFNAPTFKANKFDIKGSFGLLFKLKLDQRWSISTGISSGDLGWGFRISAIRDNTSNLAGNLIKKSASRGKNFHRFPLLLTYNFKDIEWVPLPKKDDAEQLYLFACDLEAIIGISYNRIGPFSAFDSSTDSSGVYIYNDNISYNDSYKLERLWGMSAIAGLGLQFYRMGKPKFHLLFYYSQGLVNVSKVTVDYTINGQDFTSVLHARGTIAGIQLSYPFRLKTFNKRTRS